MSVKATVTIQAYVKETVALGTTTATDPQIPYGITGTPYNYSADTTVDATKGWANTVTLTAGAATINLTTLTRTGLPTVDLTALKIRAIHFKALSTNSALITIVPGASNGYAALGLGLSLAPGGEALIHNPSSAAVTSSLKNIDLASADTDASLDVVIFAGTA